VGQVDHPAYNAPKLSIGDQEAMVFYETYGTNFVRDFGLMSPMFMEVNPIIRPIVCLKLSLIHNAMMRIASKRSRERQ